VTSAEVETFLFAHPLFRGADVFGVPDASGVQLPGRTASSRTTPSRVRRISIPYCRQLIASYKTPSRLEFVREEDVPHTVTGKVNRRELISTYAASLAAEDHSSGSIVGSEDACYKAASHPHR
jgi:fatty-acyl-CoA synthase